MSRLEGQLADIRTQIGGGAAAASAASAASTPASKPVKKKVPVKPAPVAHDTPDSNAGTPAHETGEPDSSVAPDPTEASGAEA